MEVQKKHEHQCSFCGLLCKTIFKLEEHMRKHTGERPFSCDECQRAFANRAYLNRHKRRWHEKKYEKKFKCSVCPYAANWKICLERHEQAHSGRSFPCQHPNCEYAAESTPELRSHNISKHSNERKFVCRFPSCDYRGKRISDVKNHSENKHSEYRPFVCDFEGCRYKAKNKRALNYHKLEVHRENKPFVCSVCEFCTTSKRLLRTHQLTHSENKSFKCDFEICLFAATSSYRLELHKRRVHYDRPYKCQFCNYRAVYPSKLRYHIQHHTDTNRQISCPHKTCFFKSSNPEYLKTHLRNHKAHIDCPVDGCGYVGSSSSAWKRHMQFHDPTGRPIHCPLCPKRFPTNSQLLDRVPSHTKEKPFKCPVCNFESAGKGRITDHVRAIHSDFFPQFVFDKKWTCSHCGINFGNAVGLGLHTMKLKTAVVVLTRLQFGA